MLVYTKQRLLHEQAQQVAGTERTNATGCTRKQPVALRSSVDPHHARETELAAPCRGCHVQRIWSLGKGVPGCLHGARGLRPAVSGSDEASEQRLSWSMVHRLGRRSPWPPCMRNLQDHAGLEAGRAGIQAGHQAVRRRQACAHAGQPSARKEWGVEPAANEEDRDAAVVCVL